MKVSLQKADVDTAQAIQELARQIWPDTFKEILSSEQIEYMLDMMYSIDVLSVQMTGGHLFFIAYVNEKQVGFIGLQANYPSSGTIKVHKIYVLPQFQGKGIGRILLDQAKKVAAKEDCNSLLLNVNRYNKAVNFYLNYGFEIIKEEDIAIGNGYFMNDFVMKYTVK